MVWAAEDASFRIAWNHPTDAVETKASARRTNENEKKIFTGFIAQEVGEAAKQSGYDFSGVVKPQNANDLYSLRYAEFVVPIVKAMQEQQQMIDALKSQLAELSKKIAVLEKN